MGERLEANSNAIDSLVFGGSNRWNSPLPFGAPATVTFSFMDSAPSYYGGSLSNFSTFNDQWKQLARQALQSYAAVTNLTFIEVADGGGGGQIRFGFCDQSSAGYAYAPSVTANYISESGGDVFMSTGYGGSSPTTSDDAYHVLLHEVGHALGLKHPGNYDSAGGDPDPPFLSSAEDTGSNTVMSYNGDRATQLQPYDIRAIQFLYGLKSAGTIATMTQGDEGANSAQADSHGGYFQGLGGNDTFIGAAGDDGALGGSGDDWLSGADGGDYLHAGAGTDIVYGGAGNDSLYGGRDTDQMYGGDADDWIHGNLGTDLLFGDAGDDTIYGGQSDDTIYGGAAADWIEGNLGNDALWGNAGYDIFNFGDNSGADVIYDFDQWSDTLYVKRNINGTNTSASGYWSSRITDTTSGIVVDLGSGNSVLLSGVHSLSVYPTILWSS